MVLVISMTILEGILLLYNRFEDNKRIRIILLVLSILVFSQGCLSAEDGAIGVTLKEGSLILPDKTQISIGDSFESLESLSPRFLESGPGWDSYFLTDSSSISIDIDHESENVENIYVDLYSIDDVWTEIEKVDVEGMIEVSRGMKREELMDIFEELGVRYELDRASASTTIRVNLRNFYVISFRFLDEIGGELESVQCWEEPLSFP